MTKRAEQGRPFDTEYFLDYYDQYRSSLEDLFPSERHFLPEFAIANQSYLDIGCARGGMYDIITECAAPIEYTGIDISEPLIHQARIDHPGLAFFTYDGIQLPFENSSFDRVLTLGTTVHDPKFCSLIKEA